MAASTIPNSLYESLLLKLVTVLDLTQNPEGSVTHQGRQMLLQAVRLLQNPVPNLFLTNFLDK
jgi:hypothetical protein